MIRMYGSRISYYAGKVEAYLRHRGLDYELLSMIEFEREIREGAGAVQSPVLRLEDDRWLSDSTPILAWFDRQQDGTSIYPDDPALRFAALLIEDYADEWLWRPAMHYRWSYMLDRRYASRILMDELLAHSRRPGWLMRPIIARRQHGGFVRKDGVTAATWDHVEATARESMDLLEAILHERPYVLGPRPTIADFGLVGPFFRHFSMDPTSAEILRQRAPRAYAWVARMWEAADAGNSEALVSGIDAPVGALLREACDTHLVQLRENAQAHHRGESHFAAEIQGCAYRDLPTSRYRVWCLEELRREWHALDASAQEAVRPHLTETAAILWESEPIAKSDYDPERRAPFNRAINVFGDGVPT